MKGLKQAISNFFWVCWTLFCLLVVVVLVGLPLGFGFVGFIGELRNPDTLKLSPIACPSRTVPSAALRVRAGALMIHCALPCPETRQNRAAGVDDEI